MTASLLSRLPPLRPLLGLFLTSVLALLGGCGSSDHLQEIRDAGVLRVLTRNSPTTYYEDRNGPTGFEYELAKRFADYLGVKLQIETQPSIDGIYENLGRGRADLAAAGLAITPKRQQEVDFGPGFMDVEQVVLTHEDGISPTALTDLRNARVHVLAGSYAAEYLHDQKELVAGLKWEESNDIETIDLLDQLDANEIDATIVDSNEFAANSAFYRNTHVALKLGASSQLAWALAKDPRNQRLRDEVNNFFAKLKDSGELAQLIDRYYAGSADNDKYDASQFTDNLQRTLPKYRDMIEQVAEDYDIDWRLLAAVSYAESEWKPHAVSPTGVRGMMMLTNAAAKEVGVTDRVDPLQSLRGGARYLKGILQDLPPRIQPEDKMWFALAAYNIGYGHLEDARLIAERMGKDPNRWSDVKDTLPLLQKSQYYEHTKNGYARGREPVRYVQNIRYYYNLLTWTEVAKQRTPPPKSTDQYLPDMFDATLNAL
ncbi:MAG: lytic transglycosylase [Verrucomicrobiaceae bacterium]|nr:lytic transglycosylase [Verrucomicrobiaceae bacterium]